jgi:hypothetical protein
MKNNASIYLDYKIGDIVIIIDEYRAQDFFNNGDKCIITSLDCFGDLGNMYVKLENLKNGQESEYHKSRIIPEYMAQVNKYNL